MIENTIHTTFVSQRAGLGFADAAEAAESLTGLTVNGGRAALHIDGRMDHGSGDLVSLTGTLRTGSALAPSFAVEIVLSPWSAGRTEIGLRPLGRVGLMSARSRRFVDAAWSVLPGLSEAVVTAVRSEQSTPVEHLAAA